MTVLRPARFASWAPLLCWGLALFAFATSGLSGRAAPEGGTVVARVNGEPVVEAELRRAMRAVQAGVHAELGAAAAPAKTDELIRQRALASAVRTKVQQILMRDAGVWPEIGHEAFLRALTAENARRQKAVAQGEVIYGPREYSEEAYFAYLFSNGLIRLKSVLAQSELKSTDDALRAFYEQRKAADYSRGLRADYLQVLIPFTEPGRPLDLRRKQAARTRIDAARTALQGGEDFAAVAARYNGKDVPVRSSVTEQEIAAGKLEVNPLAQAAHRLRVGETSGIIESIDSYAILRLIARDTVDYVPFEECRDAVRLRWIDVRYEEKVDRLVRAARVEVVSAP